MAFTLDRDRIRQAREALRSIAEAEEICRQGAAAGYDMTTVDMSCQYYRKRLEGILQQFSQQKVE